MFNRTLLLLVVILFVFVTACQKENLPNSPAEALVKSKTEGNSTETYFYDNQGRLSKIEFTAPSSAFYYHEYTYNDGAVSEYRSEEPRHELEQTQPNGTIKIYCSSNPAILKLNSSGYYTGSSSTCQSQSFQYDVNGFVIAEDYSMTDYSIVNTYLNDSRNILKISGKGFSFGGGEFESSKSYSYYTDKINSIGNRNFGKTYLGKSSENLIKSISENGDITNYTYLFDAQERVIQKTTLKGTTQTVTSYTYY